jgi:hypothetical protein
VNVLNASLIKIAITCSAQHNMFVLLALLIVTVRADRYATTTNALIALMTTTVQADKYAPTTNALTALMTMTAQIKVCSNN